MQGRDRALAHQIYTTESKTKISKKGSECGNKHCVEFGEMSRKELSRDLKKKWLVKVETDCSACVSHENLGCGSCGGELGNVVHCFIKAGRRPNCGLQKDEYVSPEYPLSLI